ncbi:MAG: transposase [Opitutales bacterium]|nr:transposase [Opitutales bacterium]
MATIYYRRPKVDNEVYVHVISRVVQRRYLLDREGMTEMRRILETQAVFSGIQVITFCLMQNHFHFLLRIDPKTARKGLADVELVRRFRALYGSKRSPSLGLDADMLEVVLRRADERAAGIRQKLCARMGDVSVFMRELKTRFTLWYNARFGSVGTFWAERFRSVLVEPRSAAARAVAAYIDLNPVRAGMVDRPEMYGFCGFGEACAGDGLARARYAWLGREGRVLSGKDIFSDYLAYVERLMRKERGDVADGVSPSIGRSERLLFKSAFMERAGAMGSFAWVGRLCVMGGVFGFLRARRPKLLDEGAAAGEGVHVARQWCRIGSGK